MAEFSLFDPQGNRLYLTGDERKAFLKAADSQKREVKALCQILHYTGCRVSEALELTPMKVDHSEQIGPDIGKVSCSANSLESLAKRGFLAIAFQKTNLFRVPRT